MAPRLVTISNPVQEFIDGLRDVQGNVASNETIFMTVNSIREGQEISDTLSSLFDETSLDPYELNQALANLSNQQVVLAPETIIIGG